MRLRRTTTSVSCLLSLYRARSRLSPSKPLRLAIKSFSLYLRAVRSLRSLPTSNTPRTSATSPTTQASRLLSRSRTQLWFRSFPSNRTPLRFRSLSARSPDTETVRRLSSCSSRTPRPSRARRSRRLASRLARTSSATSPRRQSPSAPEPWSGQAWLLRHLLTTTNSCKRWLLERRVTPSPSLLRSSALELPRLSEASAGQKRQQQSNLLLFNTFRGAHQRPFSFDYLKGL